MPTINFAKYQQAPVVAAPSSSGASVPAQIDFNKYQTAPAGQQQQTQPQAPQPQTVGSMLGGVGKKIVNTEQNVATEAAKAGTRTALGVGNLGLGIENTLNDATGGRITGKKPVAGVFDPNSAEGSMATNIAKRGNGGSAIVGSGIEGAAEIVGTGGDDLLVGAGKLADKMGMKSAAKVTSDIVDMVSPKLSSKQTAEAIAKRGTTKSGILRKISLNEDPFAKKIANTVKQMVPDINPKKTLTENVGKISDALSKEASSLKSKIVASGKNIIYPFRELSHAISNAEEPLSLKGTAFEKQIAPLKKAALAIAQKNGGTIDTLLDTRQEFDQLVNKTWPNLYDKDNAPMRGAVTAVRNAMNDFLQEHLPDVKYKASLAKQTDLYSAIDNMAEKAASGTEKEIGTNILQRTADVFKKHPVIKGAAIGSAVVGGGLAAYNGLKDLIP